MRADKKRTGPRRTVLKRIKASIAVFELGPARDVYVTVRNAKAKTSAPVPSAAKPAHRRFRLRILQRYTHRITASIVTNQGISSRNSGARRVRLIRLPFAKRKTRMPINGRNLDRREALRLAGIDSSSMEDVAPQDTLAGLDKLWPHRTVGLTIGGEVAVHCKLTSAHRQGIPGGP